MHTLRGTYKSGRVRGTAVHIWRDHSAYLAGPRYISGRVCAVLRYRSGAGACGRAWLACRATSPRLSSPSGLLPPSLLPSLLMGGATLPFMAAILPFFIAMPLFMAAMLL
eukprot:798741-Rhodomonas_salina.3